jgi:hypothetical protein
MNQEKESSLELQYQGKKNPFVHPIRGDLLNSQQFLLKIDTKQDMQKETEILGRITKVARFRAMADYQFTPNSNLPSTKLRESMQKGDSKRRRVLRDTYSLCFYHLFLVDACMKTSFLEIHENDINLIPAVFSRIEVPLKYQ